MPPSLPSRVTLPGEITQLLSSWSKGDDDALKSLVEMVYDSLRTTAHRELRNAPLQTLQTSALINEVYVRLAERKEIQLENRAHFFWFAGRLMRDILVDMTRAKMAAKRGDGRAHRSLETSGEIPSAETGLDPATLLAIDEALTVLEGMDPRQSQIVELRFFAGMKIGEIAEAMALSPATIKREWRMAKSWLALTLKRRRGATDRKPMESGNAGG